MEIETKPKGTLKVLVRHEVMCDIWYWYEEFTPDGRRQGVEWYWGKSAKSMSKMIREIRLRDYENVIIYIEHYRDMGITDDMLETEEDEVEYEYAI